MVLKEGTNYIIKTHQGFYKGVYVRNKGYYLEFIAHKLDYIPDITMLFTPTDKFYDYDKIKERAVKAVQNMEKRSLNMILRNVIGDNSFEW